MPRIALFCSEPLRERMAGIGVRYLEFARRLPRPGVEIVLMTAGRIADVPELPDGGVEVRAFQPGSVSRDLADCDAAVVQGGLADQILRDIGELPVAVDLYDPWLIENLHYVDELGSSAYRRDHASWSLQLSRGDYFLCSSERQRCFYLGWLAAAGRLEPTALDGDPALESLIGLVPFGLTEPVPAHRPVLPSRLPGEQRVLFGGLYDWLDPWPLLSALETLNRPQLRLLFVRNPNLDTTPQQKWQEVETWCRERGLWDDRVRAIDWIPADRRFDLFRDVDVLMIGHRDGPETWLSLRTRVVEAVAAGCPVIVSEGGATAELLRRHGVGRVVAARDDAALASALIDELDRGHPRTVPPELLASMAWERVLEPLVRFCEQPWNHATAARPGREGLVGSLRELLRPSRAALTHGVE